MYKNILHGNDLNILNQHVDLPEFKQRSTENIIAKLPLYALDSLHVILTLRHIKK